ncbi:MAG: 30S ribosomal protein S8 [Candidatus Liptonbacteria bacterium]|nr:30S ribosomal protein S8 [Candidatus Liptonbacteria bacterium]
MYYDLLVRIKNAQQARKKIVRVPYSNMDFAIANVLVRKGYLADARKRALEKRQFLELELLPRQGGMRGFKVVSKPARRLYVGYRALTRIKQGYGISVLSTPKGIMTGTQARRDKVGGEYLFEAW